jgi:hypothetical protein
MAVGPSRQQRQQHQQSKWLRVGSLNGPDDQAIEQTNLTDNVHDGHHADEEKHDIVIHPLLMGVARLVFRHHATPDH